MNVLGAVGRLARPLYLLLVALTYMLGVGISRYLGATTNLSILLIGLLVAELSLVGMSLLVAVFTSPFEPLLGNETREERRLVRNASLYATVAALAAIGFAGFAIHTANGLSAPALLCMASLVLVALAVSVPPVRLMSRGYGELGAAFAIAYLVPSLGFLLQAGEFHLLLNVSIIAITILLVAMFVALEFPSYSEDLKYDRATLLTRMGWQNALRVHNILMLIAYALLAGASLLGFSLKVFAAALLTIPFAVLQVILLRSIALGAKPIWRLLRANAVAVFALTTYLLTLGFWLR